MKRILFYLIVLAQIIVIIFLTYQFEKIDQTGHEIKIQTLSPDYPVYGDFLERDLYVEYDINKIAEDKWDNTLPLDYNTRVYILLKEENGIYRVQKASANKIDAKDKNEFVLTGIYHYHDTQHHFHYINYGLELIKHVEQYGKFNVKDELIVTVLIGKWGQRKIVAVEKWNE